MSCFFWWGKTLPLGKANQRQEGARFALLALSGINLLNFADRYVPGAVKTPIKEDLGLTDTQTALPTTGMVAVYVVCSMFFGALVDKRVADRRSILAFGVVFWSIATAIAGLAHSFWFLLLARSLVGVGEAAYVTIAIPMIADFYPVSDRNMAFMIFSLCGPLGGALGFIAGSLLASLFHWRVAFLACGIPGIFLSCLLPMMNDPVPGQNDYKNMRVGFVGADNDSQEAAVENDTKEGRRLSIHGKGSVVGDYWAILTNPHYLVCTVGSIACTFGIGGVTDWFATLMVRRYANATLVSAGTMIGAIGVIGGVCGTALGSTAAQCGKSHLRNAFLLVPALFMVPAAVFVCLGVNVRLSIYGSYLALLVGWLCFMTYLGPVSVVNIDCMPVHLRARSMGLGVMLTHLLGDVISPPIIGAISDASGLQRGMQLVWIMPLVAGACWLLGALLLKPLPGHGDDAGDKVTVHDAKANHGAHQPTLRSLLCGGDPEEEEDQECKRIILSAKGGVQDYNAAQAPDT